MADTKISALTAATTPLAGTEVLPIVQSGSTVKVANNDLRPKQIQSNATSGVLQIAGPAAAATRIMTTPDANFTVARTDAAQTFTGNQTFSNTVIGTSGNQIQGFSSYRASGSSASSPGDASMYYNAATGQTFQARAGSSYDWSLINPGNANYIARVPTGTLNMEMANGNLAFSTAAKGINFTANTPAAGMTSQLLNWYEEGTWTPTLTTSGTDYTSVTYDTAITGGRYTRIGNVIHIQGSIRTSAVTVGSASGNARIGGLPFTVKANTTGTDSIASLAVGRSSGWATNQPSECYAASGTTAVDLFYRGTANGASASMTAAEAATGAAGNRIHFAGTYICA